ncbi:histone H3.v1-like [Dioscorea cayenensis subsp. rotundata]|uniref:Histone H3.v1-like n=1 Tax=Dioscorea cayennensis subsp. rotundata TaxID=55577 RepID=A0AB40CBN3_DIOCR|nr:histone H3.v1-like [Dioscorea cayenensis subsp. rotundata]
MLRMGRWEEAQGDSSECTSGCQSGWTMYLDHSFDKQHHLPFLKPSSHHLQEQVQAEEQEEEVEEEEEEEEEEEDLSMVSDASSGPPHHHGEEECHHHCYFFSDGKRRRVEGEKQQQVSQKQDLSSFLDDTASSPLLTFSKTSFNSSMSLEFSSCFSATHFNRKSSPFIHSEKTSGCGGKEEGGKNKWC